MTVAQLTDSVTGLPLVPAGSDLGSGRGPIHVVEQGTADLRNASSLTNAYRVTRNETNATVLQTTAAGIALGSLAANDIHLIGFHIHTALAGTMTIAGFLDDAGAPRSYVIQIGAVGHIPFYGGKNAGGQLQITLSAAGDAAKVIAHSRPL